MNVYGWMDLLLSYASPIFSKHLPLPKLAFKGGSLLQHEMEMISRAEQTVARGYSGVEIIVIYFDDRYYLLQAEPRTN